MDTHPSSNDLISLRHAASQYFEPLCVKRVGYSARSTITPYELTLLWLVVEEPERKKICFRRRLRGVMRVAIGDFSGNTGCAGEVHREW